MSEQEPIDSVQQPASQKERRGAPRDSCNMRSVVTEGQTLGESIVVRVHDISATGIGLVTPERLAPGRVLVVKLRSEKGEWIRPVAVRIIHSTIQADGDWLCGGAFARRLSGEDLARILEDKAEG
jgi:hypothetical protein